MNSFIAWIGGKRLLRKEIINNFPTEIDRYIEVFGGAGWVLFAKEKHAEMEVFNDVNSNLINLYRCIKFHSSELQREMEGLLNSRELFENFKKELNTSIDMTDIQRAARYFYLIKISYGSDRKSYGTSKKNLINSIERLDEIRARLKNVIVENRDFQQIIKTYDREKALFYLDPPYFKTEKYYDNLFTAEDHERLKQSLDNMKGKFILSYNDCDYVRALYKEYNIVETERCHNLTAKNHNKEKYKELIIKNY